MEEVVGPKRIIETTKYIEELVEEVEGLVENIEEPTEDTEVEELVQDIESPAENIEEQESASGKQPVEDNNDGIFGGGHRGEGRGENYLSMLEFPIGELPRGETPMKNIPLSSLPNFHGLSSQDPDEFLFKFDILCRSYDYVNPT